MTATVGVRYHAALAAMPDDATPSTPQESAERTPASRRTFVLGVIATVLCVAAAMAVVSHNATRHEELIGYDVGNHLLYAQTLSQWRLPMPEDTPEFFSAPLPYVVPAVTLWFHEAGTDAAWEAMAESWQVANIVYAAITCVALVLLVGEGLGRDGQGWLGRLAPAGAAAMFGTLPVVSRTFSMARPDAMCAAVTVLAALGVIRLCRRPDSSLARWAACGLLLGLTPLTRQWGVLTALPMSAILTLYAFRALPFRVALSRLLLAAAVAFASGGWFYLSLETRFGSAVSFNRDADLEASKRLTYDPPPPAPGLVPAALFTTPVRENLRGRPGWMVYADFWGDYWFYYNVMARDGRGNFVAGGRAKPGARRRASGNYDQIVPYLGRVCAVAVLPTLILLAGGVWAGIAGVRRWWRDPDAAATPLVLFAAIAGTAVGFSWFVVNFAHGHSYDTAKGAYLMHIVPLVVAAMALMLAALARRRPWVATALVVLLGLAALYMFEACMTKYV